MARECPICLHPERSAIEASIRASMEKGFMPDGVTLASTRKIAAHWSLGSHNRVQEHKSHILGELPQPKPAPLVTVPERAPSKVAKVHAAALAEVTTVPDKPPPGSDPLERLEWLFEVTRGVLERVDKEGSEALALKALRELRGQITLAAALMGQLKDRVEVSGPNGGPVPIAAVVATLPAPVQQLHQEADAGDLLSQRALERWTATGRTDPSEQVAELRRMLREAESENLLIASQ